MSEVTHILGQIEDGDGQAAEKLLPLVYDELRKLFPSAASYGCSPPRPAAKYRSFHDSFRFFRGKFHVFSRGTVTCSEFLRDPV
jgi:hypothetical protein